MNPVDPLQLQRLVDGELDERQVQRMLARAKDAPDQWEEIATGFVENQTWSRAFRHDDSSQKLGMTKALSMDATAPVRPVAETGLTRKNANYSWLVMAASLMVAATIGYMANQIQNRSLPGLPIADSVPTVSDPELADNAADGSRANKIPTDARPRMTQADYHLEVPSEQLGELGTAGPVAPVPLFTVNNMEQLKQLDGQRSSPAISREMLKQLAGSGYQMEQDVDYLSGRLSDGRSFVVPIRTIRFVPGQ